jgi:hypothetical protein
MRRCAGCVDAGAGWDWEDWKEHRDGMLEGASPAARELMLGSYVEGRDDRPWVDLEV